MESSSEGRLGLLNKINFVWKGKTFIEISSRLVKNKKLGIDSTDGALLFLKPLPLKHYRREIITLPSEFVITSNFRNAQSVGKNMDAPGVTIVQSVVSPNCIENANTVIIQSENGQTNKPCSSCDDILVESTNSRFNNSKYLKSMSQADSALRRVRSAGMNRPRYNAVYNNRPENYNSSGQYLQGRNKTFKQNQFNNLRVENKTNNAENVYSSNTIQYCPSTTPETQYVPVYYKPSNGKFAKQGAVDSGSHLARLKYDTITDAGSKMREAYGLQTANALAYGVPANGYTIKDKVGYPNKCTPVIKKDGTLVKC